jgi:hypothetical protein
MTKTFSFLRALYAGRALGILIGISPVCTKTGEKTSGREGRGRREDVKS